MKIQNLCKRFGEKEVLWNLSLSFPPVACLMGPSGIGKTTLLNIIMGLEKADSGEISGLPATVAPVFQENRLCEEFSAPANLCLLKGFTRERAKAALKEAGIDDFASPVSRFSGGMKRRVALLRALLSPGELLVLDEPFKGLDEETKKTAAALLLKYRGGRDILMVTHDKEEAALVGGEIVLLPSLSAEQQPQG